MTGAVAFGILLAHLAGDYLFQSDWMAAKKTSKWWPAIVHGVTYTVPYVLVTRSPWALAVIGGTHILIDRFRLIKYLLWLKNQIGARREFVELDKPKHVDAAEWGFPRKRVDPMAWPPTETGYPAHIPAGLATALMIVADNTVHLSINFAAILWLA